MVILKSSKFVAKAAGGSRENRRWNTPEIWIWTVTLLPSSCRTQGRTHELSCKRWTTSLVLMITQDLLGVKGRRAHLVSQAVSTCLPEITCTLGLKLSAPIDLSLESSAAPVSGCLQSILCGSQDSWALNKHFGWGCCVCANSPNGNLQAWRLPYHLVAIWKIYPSHFRTQDTFIAVPCRVVILKKNEIRNNSFLKKPLYCHTL